MKKRRFVWSWPILLIICVTFCASVLQSCGAIRVGRVNKGYVLGSFNQLNALCWVSGFTIVIGAAFAYYVYVQITRLDKKIDQFNKLKHSE